MSEIAQKHENDAREGWDRYNADGGYDSLDDWRIRHFEVCESCRAALAKADRR